MYVFLNDWGQTVLKDTETFKLEVSLEEIEKISKFRFNSGEKRKD